MSTTAPTANTPAINTPSLNTPPPIQQIYRVFADLFGQSTTQIFQLEFPARVLDKGTYDYAGSDTINAQQLKPQVVQEAEFRLSNDLYGLSNLISGPTGAKLSDKYSDIVFGLIPSSNAHDQVADHLHTDQDRICGWLLEKVPNWTAPKKDLLADIPAAFDLHKPDAPTIMQPFASGEDGSKDETEIPRVDLYQKLLDAYEAERFRWVKFKTDARPKDMGTATPVAIDNYNRMLANYAPVIDKKLEAMWTMLLVRGQYHRVRRFIGFVDVESAPESLQRAKENLRASVMRSIDDTEDIYPVYFTPATWASKLSTAFKPEDLLSSEGVVRDQLFEKERERGQLMMKLNNVKASQQDLQALQDAELTARNTYTASRDTMLKGYSDTAVSLIKMYFDAKQNSTKKKEAIVKDVATSKELNDIMEEQSQPPLTEEQFTELKTMQHKCIENQTALQNASEALARTQLAAASAKGKDVSAYVYELDERISSLTVDIDYLQQILGKSDNPTLHQLTKPRADASQPEEIIIATPVHVVPQTPVVPPQDQDASTWTEQVLTLKKSASYSTSFATAHTTHNDWSVNLMFGSASGSNQDSTSSSDQKNNARNTEIQVGFRCMKVVMNRPWMNAGIFDRTQEFYRNFLSKISPGPLEDLRAAFVSEKPQGATTPKPLTDAATCVLPAYPVAFIVVKDVHIIFKSEVDFDASVVNDMQKSMSAGGGVMCFSASKSESSSEHRTAAAVAHEGKTLSIKIPAPQIIGWLQELTPEDRSNRDYNPMDPQEFVDTVKEDKAKQQQSNAPQNGLLPLRTVPAS